MAVLTLAVCRVRRAKRFDPPAPPRSYDGRDWASLQRLPWRWLSCSCDTSQRDYRRQCFRERTGGSSSFRPRNLRYGSQPYWPSKHSEALRVGHPAQRCRFASALSGCRRDTGHPPSHYDGRSGSCVRRLCWPMRSRSRASLRLILNTSNWSLWDELFTGTVAFRRSQLTPCGESGLVVAIRQLNILLGKVFALARPGRRSLAAARQICRLSKLCLMRLRMQPAHSELARLLQLKQPKAPLHLTTNFAIKLAVKPGQIVGKVIHCLSPIKYGSIESAMERKILPSEPAPSLLDAVRHHDHPKNDRQRGPARIFRLAGAVGLIKRRGVTSGKFIQQHWLSSEFKGFRLTTDLGSLCEFPLSEAK